LRTVVPTVQLVGAFDRLRFPTHFTDVTAVLRTVYLNRLVVDSPVYPLVQLDSHHTLLPVGSRAAHAVVDVYAHVIYVR